MYEHKKLMWELDVQGDEEQAVSHLVRDVQGDEEQAVSH